MRTSHRFGQCALVSGSMLARSAVVISLIALLALNDRVSAGGVAVAGTLTVNSSFAGPYDTNFGFVPGPGFEPVCAPYAAPKVAEGPLLVWPNPNPGGILHMAANWNVGEFYTTGQYTFQKPLASLVQGVLPGNNWYVRDPQLLYDWASGDPSGYGRFINVAAASDPVAQHAWITVAATYIPEGYAANNNIDDCVYAIDANVQADGSSTQFWATEPRAAMSANALVVTANMRAFADSSYQYTKLWVIPKQNIYNIPKQFCPLGPLIPSLVTSGLQNADGSLAPNVRPAKSYAVGSSTTYLLSAPGGNALTLWALDTQQLTLSPGLTGRSVPVSPYTGVASVQQEGTNTQISTGGYPLANVIYQPTSGLWTVHTTACPWNTAQSCMKWYQIDPVAGAALQDRQYGYSDASVYAPAVAVNRAGNAVFVFNYSGPNYYPSIGYAGRFAGDPTNSLPYYGTVKAGVGIYDRGAPAFYSSADVDPINDNRFFIISAYASGQNGLCPAGSVKPNQPNYDWATWVGNLSFTATPAPPPPAPPPQGRKAPSLR